MRYILHGASPLSNIDAVTGYLCMAGCVKFFLAKVALTVGLMHDEVLLISFTTMPRSNVVSAHFFHISYWYSFQFLSSGKHLHFECEAWW